MTNYREHPEFENAIHEAGHAVMALLLKRKVYRASIERTEEESGCVEVVGSIEYELDLKCKEKRRLPQERTTLLQDINIALASFVSIGMFFPGEHEMYFFSKDLDDALSLAKQLFEHYGPVEVPEIKVTVMINVNSELASFLEYKLLECAVLLKPLKNVIEVVANALIENTTLGYDELKGIFDEAKQLEVMKT